MRLDMNVNIRTVKALPYPMSGCGILTVQSNGLQAPHMIDIRFWKNNVSYSISEDYTKGSLLRVIDSQNRA
jgi:hypothetical protein